ncbi:MAG: potassium transporter, partial [Planctomycetota bacterium]
AIFTGLLFARFSRPKAKIRYSSLAVVGPYRGDGGDTAFMFRIANQRRNQLLELKAKLYYSWTIQTDRGPERSYARLLLERDDISFFPLSWTVVHPIGEESPLFGQTAEDLIENDCEFVVLLTGIDDTFHQLVHSIHSYKGDEIQFGRKFRRIATRDEPGRYVTIDLSRLDETE